MLRCTSAGAAFAAGCGTPLVAQLSGRFFPIELHLLEVYNREQVKKGVLPGRVLGACKQKDEGSMVDYTGFIETLKDKQDEVDERREVLWPRFVAFRDGLLEGLVSFAAQAVDGGLCGVTLPKIERQEEALVRARFKLNGWDLVLVAPDDFLLDALALSIREEIAPRTYYQIVDRLAPSFRIYLYRGEDEEGTPYACVQVEYAEDGAHRYQVWRYSEGEEIRPMGGGLRVNPETGREVAEKLIHHFYAFESAWREQPTLGQVREGKTQRRIGFAGPE
jgi:hypothetical protein